MSVCVITRALPGALVTAQNVAALGFDPIVIPTASIIATRADIDVAGTQALLMTSAAAAQNAFVEDGAKGLPVYAVGDATAKAAREAGFRQVISAGGDGAALAVLAADRMKPADGALLHLRGSEVAGDVTGMLNACGFQTRFVEVYRTQDHPNFQEQICATMGLAQGILLLHSPAGGRRLAAALSDKALILADWRVVGLSQACLVNLEKLGFGGLFSARTPDEAALMAAIGEI